MGYQPRLFPVSIKGVVIRDGRVLLLRDERDQWELPGGEVDVGEDLAVCVVREIAEEVGWTVTCGPDPLRLGVSHSQRRRCADRWLTTG
jgi:8-oxo-dGTP pyrophosphatase MutT (NUDIX family)